MTTDHGITLDEQIKWLEGHSVYALSRAKQYDNAHEKEPGGHMFAPDYWKGQADKHREHAGMLMAIENTLRAERSRLRARTQD